MNYLWNPAKNQLNYFFNGSGREKKWILSFDSFTFKRKIIIYINICSMLLLLVSIEMSKTMNDYHLLIVFNVRFFFISLINIVKRKLLRRLKRFSTRMEYYEKPNICLTASQICSVCMYLPVMDYVQLHIVHQRHHIVSISLYTLGAYHKTEGFSTILNSVDFSNNVRTRAKVFGSGTAINQLQWDRLKLWDTFCGQINIEMSSCKLFFGISASNFEF